MDRMRWACFFRVVALALVMPMGDADPGPPVGAGTGIASIRWWVAAGFVGVAVVVPANGRRAEVRKTSMADVKQSDGRGIPDRSNIGRAPWVEGLEVVVSIGGRGVGCVADPTGAFGRSEAWRFVWVRMR